MKQKPVQLDGEKLTLDQVVAVARGYAPAVLPQTARRRMQRSRRWVERAVKERAVVYGVTTGFGWFQNISIPPEKIRQLQRNLILSHCSGVGEPLDDEVVRAMLVLRANALAKGVSGIRVSTVESLVEMVNRRVHPVVPSQGSVGASGDLAPLAHIAAVLIGEGEAVFQRRRMSGGRAMKAAGLKPVILEAKEGLALTNGTQAMTALGVLALYDARVLVDTADIAAAMTLEAVKGKTMPFAARVHKLRPHAGQSRSARNIRSMVRGSSLVDGVDDDTRGKVQDSYSLRCAPQVHGASRDAFSFVGSVLEKEINSATDNPLILSDAETAYNAGNFHGQPVALPLDFLGLAVAELGSIAERRIAKLLDRNHNYGLPPFLAAHGGLESGLMIAQYTAAALASENKVLMHPASGDSIPTSANQEDHVSMGTIAGRQTREIVKNVRRILAIELLCAAQALDGRTDSPGTRTRQVYEAIRGVVPQMKEDRYLSSDIAKVDSLVASGILQKVLP